MSSYKVIQDIEAEDKLLGPLTLRQFIYAIIAAGCLYLCFFAITKHVVFLLVIFLPVALILGFFAFPWGRDQPTEVWALAKIRFLLKPHQRIWDQSGTKELVTITAPKRPAAIYTNGLSRSEVESRLRALASTIDTRGWATKNATVNLSSAAQPTVVTDSPDRLLDTDANAIQEVPTIDVQAADDILDEKNNPTAQHFDQMIVSSTQAHHQQLMQDVQGSSNQDPNSPPPDYWFLNQASPPPGNASKQYATFTTHVVAPGSEDVSQRDTMPTPEEEALAERVRVQHDKPEIAYQHLKTILPLSAQKKKNGGEMPTKTASPQVTQPPDPAIIALAGNNDLNVATIARQANQTHQPLPPKDEIVIALH